MSYNESFLEEYLNGSKTVALATVDEENTPIVRTLGGFASKGTVTYFATPKSSDKVKQIEKNPTASLLFQHENQEISKFINVTTTGVAEKIEEQKEFGEILDLLLNRNSRLKANQETHYIFKVRPKEIKILDFSKENIEERRTVINF